MTAARGHATAVRLANGNVLVVGGDGIPQSTSQSAVVYDARSNRWSPAGSLGVWRENFSATRLPNGKVLVAGGLTVGGSGETAVASTELYDPRSNSWSPGASMSTPRASQAAILLRNGKVLVTGGAVVGGNGAAEELASAELYDPATDTWSSAGSMGTPRANPTATVLPHGKVLVAGGDGQSANPLASAEIYDPATNSWAPAAPMSTPRYGDKATSLPRGKVLVVGGSNLSGYLSSAEVYDSATNTWASAGSMSTPRQESTLTRLRNGDVLVAGGWAPLSVYPGDTPLASTELYDPADNSWSSAGDMGTARYGATATLLPDNRVLVAGGFTPEGSGADYAEVPTASAEVYTPARRP